MSNNHLLSKVQWLGHAGFLITDKAAIYIDPFKLGFPDVGDMVLVTHDHPRHCDPDEIKWLRKGSTVIVVPAHCVAKFTGDIRGVKAGDKISVKGVNIEVLPAYTPSNQRHSAKNGGVGYIVTLEDGTRIYHTGDCGLIPEMKTGMADVLLLPVSGENTMDAVQAAAVVNLIKPKVAVPMHWMPGKQGREEAEKLRSLTDIAVELLKPVN